MRCVCHEKYLGKAECIFDAYDISEYTKLKLAPRYETQYEIIKEIIDYIHGMSKTSLKSFYEIMYGHKSLDEMLKRHVSAIIVEIGYEDVSTLVDWYEAVFMHLLMAIPCGPQKHSRLTIRVPRITAADIMTPTYE
jgi:hypothetical protein